MTLEEAIEHAEEVASRKFDDRVHCIKCAEEHRQLAEWLKDYKRLLEQDSKIGCCKDCKYFEYDDVAKVDGIPLIIAHEICSKWGDGCKTSEDGHCFLFEPREGENK